MDLGEFTLCLNVNDLAASIRFYQNLGFDIITDEQSDGWAVLQHNNLILSLYQGHIERNLLNFRGGDVKEIAQQADKNGLSLSGPYQREPDGSEGAELRDPDGNVIYLNTFPDERMKYLQGRSVFE